jgi:hypothetical protein
VVNLEISTEGSFRKQDHEKRGQTAQAAKLREVKLKEAGLATETLTIEAGAVLEAPHGTAVSVHSGG